MNNIIGALIGLACIAAWFTHIFFCFTNAAWGLLIAGALLVPIGVIHGLWLWVQ